MEPHNENGSGKCEEIIFTVTSSLLLTYFQSAHVMYIIRPNDFVSLGPVELSQNLYSSVTIQGVV